MVRGVVTSDLFLALSIRLSFAYLQRVYNQKEGG
jgi:hypothetical protein|tara:strand:+ start:1150 stop:1251 length:102 start_codon:yes stop_codon:yes gene_type:complete